MKIEPPPDIERKPLSQFFTARIIETWRCGPVSLETTTNDLFFLTPKYTGLPHSANARKLLSLALVAEDGSAEWYAELDGWELADCDPWVQHHVVPLLTGPSLSRDAARASLQDWLSARPRSVQAACDSAIDWHFLLGQLGDRPSNLAAQRHDLAPLIDTRVYNNTVTAYVAKGHPEHHALHNARAYRLGWLAWRDARKSKPC